MATSIIINPCIKCSKDLGQVICGGCQQWLCLKHFSEHRQELNHQMDNLTHQHNQLRLQSTEKKDDENFHFLINRIDSWEQKSIERIRQVANETRQKLRESIDEAKRKVAEALPDIAKSLKESRSAENFTEVEMNKWIDQLNHLRLKLEQQSTMKLVHDQNETTAEIPLIQLRVNQMKISLNINGESRWNPIGQTVVGGRDEGEALNQLSGPSNLEIDEDGTFIISDTGNSRILRSKANGTDIEILAGRKGFAHRVRDYIDPTAVLIDRINRSLIATDLESRRIMRFPLDESNNANGELIMEGVASAGLALDDEGFLYVSDIKRNEVRRYGRGNMTGLIVAGGNGQGAALNQLNRPRHIFVDQDYSVYVSDKENHRVVKWTRNAKEGVIVAGGQGQGNRVNQLFAPSGIFVDRVGSVYVVDAGNHRVVRWLKDATEGEVLAGGNGHGSQKNQLFHPSGITVDQRGNLYVVDMLNNRIQRFDITMTNLLNKSNEIMEIEEEKKVDDTPKRKRKK